MSPNACSPFQLQFDKSVASQIKIAEWNPEKDLVAMVSEDSEDFAAPIQLAKVMDHFPCFISGKSVTSSCWRPDGKAIAVGLEDGTVSLHDVENDSSNISTYEDRTSCFFPPAPRIPRMPGLVSGDTGFMDDSED